LRKGIPISTPSEHRRQKALARQKAKRKQARGAGSGLLPASAVEIYHCKIPTRLVELGIGNVVISRRYPSGQIGLAIFLLDVYCLGVKDVFYQLVDPSKYIRIMEGLERDGPLEDIDPACARKLIEGAIEYAQRFQLRPHPAYRAAQKILDGVDAAACLRSFEYGRDGKPFYVAGPNDSPAKSRQVLSLLEQQCGPEGFHYIIGSELTP